MTIRNAAKAVLLHEGKLLVNRCERPGIEGVYYDLPGGGQLPMETMEAALRRECREETGYAVEPVRFLALCEELYDSAYLQKNYPDYVHRVSHIFVCRLTDEPRKAPTESDFGQLGSEWVTPEEADVLPLYPWAMRGQVVRLLGQEAPAFLGSIRLRDNRDDL